MARVVGLGPVDREDVDFVFRWTGYGRSAHDAAMVRPHELQAARQKRLGPTAGVRLFLLGQQFVVDPKIWFHVAVDEQQIIALLFDGESSDDITALVDAMANVDSRPHGASKSLRLPRTKQKAGLKQPAAEFVVFGLVTASASDK